MITAVFFAETSGEQTNWSGFLLDGHADLDEAGRDILCAAVSALAQTVLMGLTEVVKLPTKWDRDEGYLSVRLDPGSVGDAGANVLLETVYLALEDLAKQYPDRLGIRISYSNGRGR